MPMSISRAAASGASFVCSVLSTRCPVSAASMAIWAVSTVADLADHDHVGVGPDHRARSPAAKVRPVFVFVLDLLDAVDLVLDRVLHRHDRPDPGVLSAETPA